MNEDKTQVSFPESTKYKLLKFFKQCDFSKKQIAQIEEVCHSVIKGQQDEFEKEIRKDLKALTASLIELQTTMRLMTKFIGGFAIITIPSLVTLLVGFFSKG